MAPVAVVKRRTPRGLGGSVMSHWRNRRNGTNIPTPDPIEIDMGPRTPRTRKRRAVGSPEAIYPSSRDVTVDCILGRDRMSPQWDQETIVLGDRTSPQCDQQTRVVGDRMSQQCDQETSPLRDQETDWTSPLQCDQETRLLDTQISTNGPLLDTNTANILDTP